MEALHLVLFDLNAGGHHGQYVKQLATYWCARAFPGRLSILVTSPLLEKHPDLAELVAQCERVELQILERPLSDSLFRTALMQGRVLRNALNRLQPTHCLLLDFDLFQLPLAFGLRFNSPLSLSGVYFRPFARPGPRASGHEGLRNFVRYIRKRVVLNAALRNQHFAGLFSLDPYFTAEYHSRTARILTLPDGVEPRQPSAAPLTTRRELGVEGGREVALFFGSLAERKGVYQTLEAVRSLASSHQAKLCLVLAGAVAPADQEALLVRLDEIKRSTDVQVLAALRFVSDTEMINLFSASDLILLPYQRHGGSSGILVRAAQAGKPVLGSDYGLVGRYIHDFGLGLAVDSSDSAKIANGLSQWLESPQDYPFDAEKASIFGKRHTATRFAEVIFSQVYSRSAREPLGKGAGNHD